MARGLTASLGFSRLFTLLCQASIRLFLSLWGWVQLLWEDAFIWRLGDRLPLLGSVVFALLY